MPFSAVPGTWYSNEVAAKFLFEFFDGFMCWFAIYFGERVMGHECKHRFTDDRDHGECCCSSRDGPVVISSSNIC